VGGIPTASAFPVATLAQRVWGGAWGAAALRAAELGHRPVHRVLQRRHADVVRDGPVRRAAEDGRKGEPDQEDAGQRESACRWGVQVLAFACVA